MVTAPESGTRRGMQDAFEAARADCAVPGLAVAAYTAKRRIGAWLFAGWAVLSLAWTGFILVDLYNRAAAQADMSRQVELELDSATCTEEPCKTSLRETPQEDWSNIAETYVQFGYVSLLEWTIAPPAILLVVGIGGTIMLRRRVAARA